MPLMYGKDTKGKYVKWGKSGKKYHYSGTGKKAAEKKAKKQARAIYSAGWKGK